MTTDRDTDRKFPHPLRWWLDHITSERSRVHGEPWSFMFFTMLIAVAAAMLLFVFIGGEVAMFQGDLVSFVIVNGVSLAIFAFTLWVVKVTNPNKENN